ncbi:integrator complex subunit 11 [Dermatophagoides pteronyssinus]|uniref:Integrator complex subunit 11 n=2 Tax=Dermatophagoides pteronyssinus TaxID=6956 RepID=A0ABQ8JNI2_DERPT|nr:integrator complex subunit 11-like [Dermatophagoides pteronyssinus]KAH9424163.1 Integrator complex subunit 11 [Dermatophagoides pteronyssinus]
MSDIKITPLGAGQDVGRSCILVTIGSQRVMLDCGMHMGYNDQRRFPDFSYVSNEESLDSYLDCVIISHFHLDHCGALPYMTEMVGYKGPIYMTHPTKAICPILLEDFRKITVERKGETNFFTSQMIKDCMRKVIPVNLHETVKVNDELEIKAYYAGHVLGAAMFHIRSGQHSLVYTGDYNMTPDRHLGSAWIDKCRPDVLITESTYATTIRDSKRCRERDFLMKVHECIERGGKVLIPVFALGRAQELCILLETYWDRMNLKTPIYFAVGLTEKATNYYKLFIPWTNQKIKKTFVKRNMFEFRHIKPFDRAYADNKEPMVVFATPGMLHAGLSLQLFRKWAPDPNNMVIMPGYCVAGTVGYRLLNGAKKIEFENKQFVDVKLQVRYMSFSAHADAKGIMTLIKQCEPKNVVLVHGEASKMAFLNGKIKNEFHIDCYYPANGETIKIDIPISQAVDVDVNFLKRTITSGISDPKRQKLMHGTLKIDSNNSSILLCSKDELEQYGIKPFTITFKTFIKLENEQSDSLSSEEITQVIYEKLKSSEKLSDQHVISKPSETEVLISQVLIQVQPNENDQSSKEIIIKWPEEDEALGSFLLNYIQGLIRCSYNTK